MKERKTKAEYMKLNF